MSLELDDVQCHFRFRRLPKIFEFVCGKRCWLRESPANLWNVTDSPPSIVEIHPDLTGVFERDTTNLGSRRQRLDGTRSGKCFTARCEWASPGIPVGCDRWSSASAGKPALAVRMPSARDRDSDPWAPWRVLRAGKFAPVFGYGIELRRLGCERAFFRVSPSPDRPCWSGRWLESWPRSELAQDSWMERSVRLPSWLEMV